MKREIKVTNYVLLLIYDYKLTFYKNKYPMIIMIKVSQ